MERNTKIGAPGWCDYLRDRFRLRLDRRANSFYFDTTESASFLFAAFALEPGESVLILARLMPLHPLVFRAVLARFGPNPFGRLLGVFPGAGRFLRRGFLCSPRA